MIFQVLSITGSNKEENREKEAKKKKMEKLLEKGPSRVSFFLRGPRGMKGHEARGSTSTDAREATFNPRGSHPYLATREEQGGDRMF